VKIWMYDDGLVLGVGKGHSGAVTSVKFSPDRKKMVRLGKARSPHGRRGLALLRVAATGGRGDMIMMLEI
jgi:hypothetical protein